MNEKNFPWSQFQLIDAVAAAFTNKMFRWGMTTNSLVPPDHEPTELDPFIALVNAGNYIIQTQPDECGEIKFQVGDAVVERASGIFAQAYIIKSMAGGIATLTTDGGKEIVTHVAKIRGDGIAFLPSNQKVNEINITGLPISDIELIHSFLNIVLSQGQSSIAWTELRYIAEVPEQEGLEHIGWNFYDSCKEYAKRYLATTNSFSTGDIVVQSLTANILSGDYGAKNEPFIGVISGTVNDSSTGIQRYVVQTKDGNQKRVYQWDLFRLADRKVMVK